MAVGRQFNWLSQERVDLPFLRMIESAVAGDFDTSMGYIVAGGTGYFLNGFTVSYTIGQPATTVAINVANGALVNVNASQSGSIFQVGPNVSPEVLSATNSNVIGGFTPNTVNHVGIDLLRVADATTTDQASFLSANQVNGVYPEYQSAVPLARVLQYRFYITTASFSSLPSVLPICSITTDVNNNVISITDARPFLERLGTGGDVPAPSAFGTLSAIEPAVTSTTATTPFGGLDKGSSLKSWMNTVMTKLWLLSGGGNTWYSPATSQAMRLIKDPANQFSNGDNFQFSGGLLSWKGLRVVFANAPATSTSYFNAIVDNPGGVAILPGQCLYVDLNESSTYTPLTPVVASMASLGYSPANGLNNGPGNRFVIAWCDNPGGTTYVFNAGSTLPVGFALVSPATQTIYGTVRTNVPLPTGQTFVRVPVANEPSPTINANTVDNVLATGITRGDSNPTGFGAGDLYIGNGVNDNNIRIGGRLLGSQVLYATVSSTQLTDGSTGTIFMSGPSISLQPVSTSASLVWVIPTHSTVAITGLAGSVAGGSSLFFDSTLVPSDTNTDFLFVTSTSRAAGNLLQIRNNLSFVFSVTAAGQVSATSFINNATSFQADASGNVTGISFNGPLFQSTSAAVTLSGFNNLGGYGTVVTNTGNSHVHVTPVDSSHHLYLCDNGADIYFGSNTSGTLYFSHSLAQAPFITRISGGTGYGLGFWSNLAASDSAYADFTFQSQNNRTSGNLLSINNQSTAKYTFPVGGGASNSTDVLTLGNIPSSNFAYAYVTGSAQTQSVGTSQTEWTNNANAFTSGAQVGSMTTVSYGCHMTTAGWYDIDITLSVSISNNDGATTTWGYMIDGTYQSDGQMSTTNHTGQIASVKMKALYQNLSGTHDITIWCKSSSAATTINVPNLSIIVKRIG